MTRESSGQKITLKQLRGTSPTLTTSCGRMKQSSTWMDVKRHNDAKAGVMVWAGLIKEHIIGPFFINRSVTGQVYLQLLQQRVWPALQAIMGEEEEFVVYQHDGASAHYETHVRAWLGWTTEGWAEGDPYHGQHEVLIYLRWTSGCGVT